MTIVQPEVEQLELTDLVPYEESNNPNRKTHIVNPPDNPHISYGFPDMEGPEVVNIARAMGIPVLALCGYTWIPKHNPEKFDICDACMTVAGNIMRENGE